MVYYYKGKFQDSLSIDVNNLALLRGYSAFEYLRTYNRRPFCLKAHIARFLHSIQKMGLSISYSADELEKLTWDLVSKETGECGVKWYATGGISQDGLRHSQTADVFAFTLPMTTISSSLFETGIKTETFQVQRPLPEAKTTAYFQACQILSSRKDLHEIIYLSQENSLLEASTSNLFLVKGKTLYTAQKQVLHGITREVVLNLVKGQYDVIFEEVPYHQLGTFDEIFITATNKEILPVSKVDNFSFKVGPITQSISLLFKDHINKSDRYEHIPELYQNELLLKS